MSEKKEEKGIVKYTTANGEIKLSLDIINKYLVSGGGKLTEQEGVMFMALCSMQKLNPFLREVYPIKYGSNPVQAVTGIETFRKRAFDNPKYRGHRSWIEKWTDTEKVAKCEVFVAGYEIPVSSEVDYEEYVARKSDGKVNKMWSEKPRTMLKKVAESQALRTAFPKEYGGMYTAEEINSVVMENIPKDHVNINDIEDAIFTDDNDNPASSDPQAAPESNTGDNGAAPPSSQALSAEQIGKMKARMHELKKAKKINDKDILDQLGKYGASMPSELSPDDFDKVMVWLKEIEEMEGK